MKIAVISANFGDFDHKHPFPEQSVPCDRLYYNELNSVYPLASLTYRMRGKFYKMQAHKFLKEYDVFVWLDSNVKVKSPHMIAEMLKPLQDNQVSIRKHPERTNIYEELAFIKQMIEKGNKYLKLRYNLQSLIDEVNDIGPGLEGLYACGLFARLNTPAVNEMFDFWWETQFLFNDFDQIRFVQVSKSLKVGNFDLGNFYKNDYYELTPHKVIR